MVGDGGVAPFAGAWIEIWHHRFRSQHPSVVAPFAGAWIEIGKYGDLSERPTVAPFAGAWIEIRPLLPLSISA